MQADLQNGGRWHHIATEHEVRAALSNKQATVVEVPAIASTFVISYAHRVMVRTTAMGGDTFNVEGGWTYDNPFSLMIEHQEVSQLAANSRRT